MKKREAQVHKIFSENAPAGHIAAFALPVYVEIEDEDNPEGADRTVKPGVVQCIVRSHPKRKDGKSLTAPFLVPCPQGLGNFEDHVRTHHDMVIAPDRKAQPSIAQAFAASSSKKTRTTEPVRIGTRAFTRMVCEDNAPFAMVERKGFRGVLNALSDAVGRQITTPSRNQVAKDVDEWYDEKTVSLRFIATQENYCLFFSLTMDGWKNVVAHKPMRAASVHFMTENGNLVSIPLEVSVIQDKSALGIRSWFIHALRDKGFSERRLISVTTDMCSAEVASINRQNEEDGATEETQELARFVLEWNQFIESVGISHNGCKPHKASTSASAAIKNANLLAQAKLGRAACQYVNNHYKVEMLYSTTREDPQYHVHYTNNAGEEKEGKVQTLADYSDSRFVGAVLCTKRLLANRSIWNVISDEAQKASNVDVPPWKSCPRISPTDWDRCADIVTLLDPLTSFIELHSGRHYPTLNEVIPSLIMLRSRLNLFVFGNSDRGLFIQMQLSEAGRGSIRTDAGKRLLWELLRTLDDNFAAEFSDPATLAAMYLDPRYRDFRSVYTNKDVGKWKQEERALQSELRREGGRFDLTRKMRDAVMFLYQRLFPEDAEADRQEVESVDPVRQPLWIELDRWGSKFLDHIGHKALEPNDVWQDKMVRLEFPRVVKIQRAVYGITASAVDVETIWSKMKLVATRLRANLQAARAGKQAFLALYELEEERMRKLGDPFPCREGQHAVEEL